MIEKKSILTLTKALTEDDYRAFPAYSYSKISAYKKYGPKSLINNTFTESDGSILGTLMDLILSYGIEEVNKIYYVADIKGLSDKTSTILAEISTKLGRRIEKWEDTKLLEILNSNDYYINYKDETKLKKFKSEIQEYFESTAPAGGKYIIPTEFFNSANDCVNALVDAPFKEEIFCDSSEDIEIVPQAIFIKPSTTENQYAVKIKIDKLIVNHINKTIRLVDYKITSDEEINFIKSLFKFNYDFQAEIYSDTLLDIISEDEYFKEFKILPFTFVVINPTNLSPLAWEYPQIHRTNWQTYLSQIETNIQTSQYKYLPKFLENNCIIPLNIKYEEPSV